MNTNSIKIFQETMPVENLEIIPISFVGDYFKLDYKKQNETLKTDENYQEDIFNIADKELYGDDQKRVFLSKNGFIRWILQINPSSIDSKLKGSFIEYQRNLINYLFNNAYEQQRVLLRVHTLKSRKDELYKKLHNAHPDFVEFIDIQAEIMRLGKESKNIQQNIVHSSQTKLF